MTNSSRADTRTQAGHASSAGDSGMLVERRVREGRIPRVSSYTITLYWRYDRLVIPPSALPPLHFFWPLHSLSLSLSLLRLSMPISGFPSSYLEYISTYITIVRRDGSMERSAEQSVTRCRIDREEISPKTNISLPTTNRGESSRNRDDRISLPSEPGIVTISGLRGENDL